jgi:hypothetical protein
VGAESERCVCRLELEPQTSSAGAPHRSTIRSPGLEKKEARMRGLLAPLLLISNAQAVTDT